MAVTKSRVVFWFGLWTMLLGGNFVLTLAMPDLWLLAQMVNVVFIVYSLCSFGVPQTWAVPALALGFVPLLLSLGASVWLPGSLLAAWSWSMNAFLFWCLIQWVRNGYTNQLWKVQWWTVLYVCFTCVIQVLLKPSARPGSIFALVDETGGYLSALLLPLSYMLYEQKPGAASWYFSWQKMVFPTMCLIVLLLNQTRGAFLSLGVGCFVLLCYGFRKLSRRVKLGVVLSVALTALLVGFMFLEPQHYTGDSVRLDTWRVALDMINKYPYGVGIGGFALAYQKIGVYPYGVWLIGVPNMILSVGAEMGLLGLLCGAALLLVIAYEWLKLRWSAFQWVVFAALCGIAAEMMVDYFPTGNFAFLVMFYVAILLAPRAPKALDSPTVL